MENRLKKFQLSILMLVADYFFFFAAFFFLAAMCLSPPIRLFGWFVFGVTEMFLAVRMLNLPVCLKKNARWQIIFSSGRSF